MPHLFINRPRLHNPTRDKTDLHSHFRWESINAIIYLIGGIVFIIGSVFFFPAFEKYIDAGAYIFLFGSLLYLIVTGHDMVEVHYHRLTSGRSNYVKRLEIIAAVSYLVGTIMFTVGSVFFLSSVGLYIAGTWLFIIGSLLFVVGACINVLQIITARSIQTLQLMNLTAVSYVVGSVLFMVASVPYLWHVKSQTARTTLFTYLAWQYVIGSVLFFAGGVFNYWRAWLVVREELKLQSREH